MGKGIKMSEPQQGSAWSESHLHEFVCRHPDARPQLTLTITGDEEEIRQYLDGPRLAGELHDLIEKIRRKGKDETWGHVADEMFWVVEELEEIRSRE